jgi:ribosome-binding factor A
MPSEVRLTRISNRLREDLSEMLVREISDPRLGGVFVTDVKVDRELAYADIFVSAVEGHERAVEILAGLNSASGYIRKKLSSRVDLRVFPRLRFHWDPTPEKADHIERLLADLRKQPAEEKPKPANEG